MSNILEVLRPGKTGYAINNIIAGRWSSRAIDPEKPLSPEVFGRIIEAGRWAPSAFNNQPWRFMAFGPEDPEALAKARTVLLASNQWAHAAPRLFFSLCRTDNANGKGENNLAPYETGMSVIQMALQAAEEGLVFHQMKGFSRKALRETFQVPENFLPLTAVAVGWPGDVTPLPEMMQALEKNERIRKEHAELLFSNGNIPRK